MKKFLFSFIILTFVTINTNAQLKVDSIGRIRLNNKVAVGASTNFSVNAGLQTYNSLTNGTYYGLYSKVDLYNNGIWQRSVAPVYGLILSYSSSPAGKSSSITNYVFSAAVAGVAQKGVGVYGATGTALPLTLSGDYAGYFNGSVKATGTMTASSFVTSSDRRLKTDIADLSHRTSELIYNLRPVSYKLNVNDTLHFRYDADAQEVQNTHFGLIAQELQELYPNLVYENEGDGYLSINYTELIPLLISTIQEQNDRITALESQLSQDNSSSQKQVAAKNSVVAKLYQNNPNPFNQSTAINYDLPLETNQANLYIYDMNGTQIAAYSLTELGCGSITISAGELNAGMYLYSLIADGQLVDTKQMILTK